jgi:hypothetical protein
MSDNPEFGLPPYVDSPLFPFEGALRVKAPMYRDADPLRSGEPGGPPCRHCSDPDDAFIWVDDHWRVRARAQASVAPALVFLETREHVDLDGLSDERAAELGTMIVRLDRAIQAIGDIGRVQVHRWGDGAEHFHLWFYARPVGAFSLLGYGMSFWEPIVRPIADDVWHENIVTVARGLARHGGRAVVTE